MMNKFAMLMFGVLFGMSSFTQAMPSIPTLNPNIIIK